MLGRALSIRYKILLLLTLIPLVTLAVYLALAVKIFEDDKVAYVFETSAAVARTMSNQATTDLNSALAAARPIMQEFFSEKNFGPVSRAVFESDSSINWVAAFQKNTNSSEFQKLGQTEKYQGQAERDLQSFGNLNPLLEEALQKGRLLRVPFKDERVLMAVRSGQEGATDAIVFFVLAKIPTLASSFHEPNAADVFLINDLGYILFGPAGNELSYLTERFSLDFLDRAREKNYTSGTEEIQSTEGADYLASFAKPAFGDMVVVSFVKKEDALMAVNTLLQRSIIFFVFLISATTIVSLVASGTLTSSLRDLFSATKKVAEGHFDVRVDVKSKDEVGSLAKSFNVMAEEVSRLMMETAEKSRMESELKTAQTVQETLFPPAEGKFADLRIAGYYSPASECGGDWWHYCEVGDKIYLWIGDATGHGAPAALITSAAKSASTIIERLDIDPAHALELLNRAIYDVSRGRIMMTFFLACYDPATRLLTYSNASHEAPYLIPFKEGKLSKKDLNPLNEVNSPRLGQGRDTQYEQTSVQLQPGDRILFYTDGIPDIQNQKKESWGERAFLKSVVACNQDFPEISKSVQAMVSEFSNFRENASLVDDITFFMVAVERSST